MGNQCSSCNSNFLSPRSKPSTKLILPSGEIRKLQDSVKAGEIMIEWPNFFLVNSNSLNVNKRFLALSADEELEGGNVYFMFPMRRMKSVVTVADIGGLRNDGKLEGNAEVTEPEMETEMEFSYRLVVCRSRKPLLDTIAEETVFCR